MQIQEEKEKASDGVKQASSSGESSAAVAGDKATPQQSQPHSEESSEDKVQQQQQQQGEELGSGATLDEVTKLKVKGLSQMLVCPVICKVYVACVYRSS